MVKIIRGLVFFLLFAVGAAWVIEQYRPRSGPSVFDQAYRAVVSGGPAEEAGPSRGGPPSTGPSRGGAPSAIQSGGAQSGGGPPGGAPGGQRTRPPTTVEVVAAAVSQVQENIEAVGSTRANRSVDVVSLASGRVASVHFQAGDRVAAGALLVSLEDGMERVDLSNSKATLDEAERTLKRTEQLAERGNVSEAALDQARANVVRAKANHDQDQLALDDMTVEAPFEGVMGFRLVEPGARIDPSTVIGRLDDLSEIDLEFRLPETVFSQVEIGLAASATAAAFPGRVFEGKVSLIDQRIDEASRSFVVRVAIPNEAYELPSGMFMVVDLTLQARESVVVPEEAVVSEAGVSYVYVLAEGVIDRREVALGLRQSAHVEIITGLAAGEKVVTRGVQKVRDGAPAQALKTQALENQALENQALGAEALGVAADGDRVAQRPPAAETGGEGQKAPAQ